MQVTQDDGSVEMFPFEQRRTKRVTTGGSATGLQVLNHHRPCLPRRLAQPWPTSKEAVRVAIVENDQREFDRGNGQEMKNTRKSGKGETWGDTREDKSRVTTLRE